MNETTKNDMIYHRRKALEDLGWRFPIHFSSNIDAGIVRVIPPQNIIDHVGYVEDASIASERLWECAIAFAEGFQMGYELNLRIKNIKLKNRK